MFYASLAWAFAVVGFATPPTFGQPVAADAPSSPPPAVKESKQESASKGAIPSIPVSANGVTEKVLRNAIVKKVYPDGILFMHESGMSKVPFEKLPRDIQEKHGYNPEAAAKYANEAAKLQKENNRELEKQSAIAQKKNAEKDAAYWRKETAINAQKESADD